MFYKTNPILNKVNKMNFRNFTNLFPLLIVCLSTFFATSCKDEITEPLTSILTKDNIAKLEAAADNVMMSSQTPGLMAYISVEGEGEGLSITRGVSNLVTSEPMNINNYFRIGSITKTITAEAVLILADEGKIDLNKSISFYLPELNIPSGDKITIRMLGNMTSGLYNYTDGDDFWTPLLASNGQQVLTAEQDLALAFSHPMLSEPGTQYYYCNTNFLLLGSLIKKVTGKPVIDVFNEKIFQPLGMKHTFWPNTRYLPYPYNHGYSLLDLTNTLTDVTNWDPTWGDAAGILVSNFFDLKIWAKELHERKLLSEKMKSERYAWVNADTRDVKYSGFGLEKIYDWIGHPGSIPGSNSEIWYNTVTKTTVIINTNSIDGAPADFAFYLFFQILSPLK